MEKFYKKATEEDKARCIELITALDISDAAKKKLGLTTRHTKLQQKRPQTAMAELDRPPYRHPVPLGPYATTYNREFAALPGPGAAAERPGSTQAYAASYDLNGPIGNSTYSNEFYQKLQKKAAPIRTGTASGDRRNNPHPLETFMNWRLPPRPMAEQPYSEWGGELTDEILDAVCRGKIASTYQQDYLGIPQGYHGRENPNMPIPPTDWKSKVKYSLDSSTRRCYQQPSEQPELKGNTIRYGCNKTKSVPANGVVPTTSKRQQHIKNHTSYELDYFLPGEKATYETRDYRQLSDAWTKQYADQRGSSSPGLRMCAECLPPISLQQSEPQPNLCKRTKQYPVARRRHALPEIGNHVHASENHAHPAILFPPGLQRLRLDLHTLQAGTHPREIAV